MYELTQLGAHTWYIAAGTNAGVWLDAQGRAWLIDSGLNDRDAAAFLSVLQAQGWPLAAVLNTHYHADHIGGNRHLQQATGVPCYCPQPVFANEPLLNPSFMFGAAPPAPLRVDAFLAQPSRAQALTAQCLPEGLSLVSLPGHAYEHYGILTADGVCFAADAVAGEAALARFGMTYLYDLQRYLASIEALCAVPASLFVPSHAQPTADIRALAEVNRAACEDVLQKIRSLCADGGLSQDQLLKALFDGFRRHLHLAQYALSSCTLHAYLGYLIERGEMQARAKENILLFRTL